MKPKILVVDDQKEDRQKLREALERKCEIEEAESGEGAIEKIKNFGDFDVVLLDVYMPEDKEVGLDFLKKIRSADPNTKVIMVKVEGRVKKAIEYVQAGASSFVTKPFNPSVLLNVISKAIGRKFREG